MGDVTGANVLALIMAYFAFHQLGNPSFAAREAASRRCDCLLGAVLAPAGHPDPEVRRRADAIRAKWVARVPHWVAPCADPAGTLLWSQACKEHRVVFLTAWPLPEGMDDRHLNPPYCPYGDGWGLWRHMAWHRPAVRAGMAAFGGGLTCR